MRPKPTRKMDVRKIGRREERFRRLEKYPLSARKAFNELARSIFLKANATYAFRILEKNEYVYNTKNIGLILKHLIKKGFSRNAAKRKLELDFNKAIRNTRQMRVQLTKASKQSDEMLERLHGPEVTLATLENELLYLKNIVKEF